MSETGIEETHTNYAKNKTTKTTHGNAHRYVGPAPAAVTDATPNGSKSSAVALWCAAAGGGGTTAAGGRGAF